MRQPRNHISSFRTGAHHRVLAAGTVVLAAVTTFLLLPALASIPQRLASGCGRWLALGALFELMSAAGYVVAFRLSFGEGNRWSASWRTGLRVLAATTALPAGAVLGPALGARITRPGRDRVATRALAFVLLTNAPDVAAVTVVGIALRLRLLPGPHAVGLTLAPAVGAVALLAGVASLPSWLRADARRPRHALARGLARAGAGLEEGVRAAAALLHARDWKLTGPLAYYAFDNAVLWAAFRALGHSPPVAIIVIAYVLGQSGSLLPVPGGVGGGEAALIGTLVLYGTAAGPAAAAVLVYRALSLSVPLALGAGACVSRRPLAAQAMKRPGAVDRASRRRRAPRPARAR
jgi:uncharacterized membrane protein YbhN (UPF0104 family)